MRAYAWVCWSASVCVICVCVSVRESVCIMQSRKEGRGACMHASVCVGVLASECVCNLCVRECA